MANAISFIYIEYQFSDDALAVTHAVLKYGFISPKKGQEGHRMGL